MPKDRFTEQRRKEREENKDNRNEAHLEEVMMEVKENGRSKVGSLSGERQHISQGN